LGCSAGWRAWVGLGGHADACPRGWVAALGVLRGIGVGGRGLGLGDTLTHVPGGVAALGVLPTFLEG
jgi:hypothetical protein